MPNSASAPAPTRSCGTRVSRSRAIVDSTTPTRTATTPRPANSAATASGPESPARETSTLTTRTLNSASLSALPYRISARSGPLWSSTITSWIIVSSRWVAGSSTGTRQFSARRSTKRLAPTRQRVAPEPGHAAASGAPSMPESERSPVASTSAMRQRNSVGSAKLAIVTSRLAPIPSKLEPVSIPASTSAKRPSASNPANATRSPAKLTGAARPSSGRNSAATTSDASTITGPARNTQVVVRL